MHGRFREDADGQLAQLLGQSTRLGLLVRRGEDHGLAATQFPYLVRDSGQRAESEDHLCG